MQQESSNDFSDEEYLNAALDTVSTTNPPANTGAPAHTPTSRTSHANVLEQETSNFRRKNSVA